MCKSLTNVKPEMFFYNYRKIQERLVLALVNDKAAGGPFLAFLEK